VVVLLVTIKDIEAWAVLSYMSPPESNGQPLYTDNRTTNLYDPMRKTVLSLGMFGGHKTALLWTKVGEDSRAEIEKALKLLPNIQLIATVGVAYGMDSKKLKLGDVLVSTTIDGIGNIRWENGKLILEEGDNRYTRVEQRALDVFATEVDDWVAITKFNLTSCGRQPNVHADAIIGIPWFINDVNILSQVISNSPAVIGGEMEGQVIASIHNDLLDLNPPKEIDVIVIKGVAEFAGHGYGSCDWYLTASMAAAGYMNFKLKQTKNQICE
jgi:nucleoside phosphorylase